MEIITTLISIIITFPLSGIISAAFLEFILNSKQPKRLSDKETLIYGLILGPVTISFLLFLLFIFFPKSPDLSYFSWVIGIFAVAAFLSQKHLKPVLLNFLESCKCLFSEKKKTFILFKILIVLFFLHVLYQGIVLPIVGHDALIYARYGKTFYIQKSLDDPFKEQNPYTGEHYAMIHPPGIPLLYTWFYILQGNTDHDYTVRSVAPLYGIYLTILVWSIVKRRSSAYSAMLAVMLLISTPIFSFQTIGNSIDTMRISLIFLTFHSIIKLLHSETFLGLLLTIAVAGLSIFVHLGGISILPITVLLYIMFSKRIKWEKAILGLLLVLAALSQPLIWNSKYCPGKSDPYYLLNPKLSYQIPDSSRRAAFGQEWLEKVKTSQVSPVEILWKERLQIFSRVHLFGITFYTALAGIIWSFFLRKKKTPDYIFLFGMALFAIPVLYKYYINYRYISTITPAAVYFGGLFLGSLYISAKKKHDKVAHLCLTAVLLGGIAFCLLFFFIGIKSPDISATLTGKPSLTERLVLNIKKFATWKSYAHPMLSVMETAIKITPENARILIIRAKDAIYYYYSKNRQILWYSNTNFTEPFSKIKEPQEAFDFLRKKNIVCVITDSIYESHISSDFPNMIIILRDSNFSELISEKRGIRIYRLKTIPY